MKKLYLIGNLKMNMSYSELEPYFENLKNIAMSFYGNLDSELGQVASNIISTSGLINVTDYRRTKRFDGTTWYDYINNVPYVNVSRAGTIEDAQVFCGTFDRPPFP